MSSEELTHANHGAPIVWGDDAASGGYDTSAHIQLHDSVGEWEPSYLLPQWLPGGQYPTYHTNAVISGWLTRLFGGLWALPIISDLLRKQTTDTLHKHAISALSVTKNRSNRHV